MARIFYSMSGEGRGHATRARAVAEILRHRHDLTLFAPRMAYEILSRAFEGTNVRVRRLAGLRFQYHQDRLSYAKTVRSSFAFLKRMRTMIRSLRRRIERERPDLAIVDFEPLLPRAARASGLPFISFDHQHSLAVTNFSDLPIGLRIKAEFLAQFTRWFYRGQKGTIVSSFYDPPRRNGLRSVFCTGILLRPEILAASPTLGEHLLVYQRRMAHPVLFEHLRRLDRPVSVYGLGSRPMEGNITFRDIDELGFVRDLASCHSLITSAGNQLVGEALYLRKPVLAIPEAGNVEQRINAHYLPGTRGGRWIDADRVTPQAINAFLAEVETLRAQIQPDLVRGNERAAELIELFLPVSAPSPPLALTVLETSPSDENDEPLARASDEAGTSLSQGPVSRSRGEGAASKMRRMLGFARAVFRNHLRRRDLPRMLTYTVTFVCNAKCVMCDSWRIPPMEELTVDDVSRLYDQLPVMDAVRLTGGEPFVRGDLPEIARLTQEKLRPLILHITTNGFLTRRIVRYCEERRRSTPLHLLVSIDGVEGKHNEIRGNSSAWKNAMETIQWLAPRQAKLGLKLAVNQTIVDEEGLDHYRRLREILRPLGVRNNVVMAYQSSATYNLERGIELAPKNAGDFTTFTHFDKEVVRELFAEIDRDLKHFPLADRWAKRYYLRGIMNRLLGQGAKPNPKCVALNSHFRVFPNGDVPTCQFNSKVIGNVRRQSFQTLWTSLLAEEQRKWVHACQGCWAECEVLPSAIYTLDLLKENLFGGPLVFSAGSRVKKESETSAAEVASHVRSTS